MIVKSEIFQAAKKDHKGNQTEIVCIYNTSEMRTQKL